MQSLYNTKPKRLFTFGCSFTQYFWPTWADVLANELKIPFHNYGRCGAGNPYIFNKILQADNFFNFDQDDLVMVAWTNVCREDRFVKGAWHSPGNIYNQTVYEKSYVDKWADPAGYAVRDFALIKAASVFLESKQCQTQMMKMLDFEITDQFMTVDGTVEDKLVESYSPWLSKIHDSFYDVLWGNNLAKKLKQDQLEIGDFARDHHPNVIEHMSYLQKTFQYQFAQETVDQVQVAHAEIVTKWKQEKPKCIDDTFKLSDRVWFSKPYKQSTPHVEWIFTT